MKMNHVHEHSGTPAQFLVENIELLPRGYALDIAMGAGRNAVYLSEMGFLRPSGYELSDDGPYDGRCLGKLV